MGYQGARVLVKALETLKLPKDVSVLDVGCGTGLAGVKVNIILKILTKYLYYDYDCVWGDLMYNVMRCVLIMFLWVAMTLADIREAIWAYHLPQPERNHGSPTYYKYNMSAKNLNTQD